MIMARVEKGHFEALIEMTENVLLLCWIVLLKLRLCEISI